MKIITLKDLRESLTLLLPSLHPNEEGGEVQEWREGPHIWACLTPLGGGDAAHSEKPGGAMALPDRYVSAPPPVRYKMVVRYPVEILANTQFVWHLSQGQKRLHLTSYLQLIQHNKFLSMTVMEV